MIRDTGNKRLYYYTLLVCTIILASVNYCNNCDAQNITVSHRVTFPFSGYDTITVTFLGDLMQHQPQISSAGNLAKYGGSDSDFDYSHTFKYVKDILTKSNISVANMEFTLGDPPYSGYPCFKAPYAIADAAYKSGINLFLTANNHICDKGLSGIEKTLSYYISKGYPFTGSCNTNNSTPYEPHIRIINGIKLAFINFTYGTNGLTVKAPYSVNYIDSTKIKEAIQRAVNEEADIIIALPHWGEEYQLKANNHQRKFADMLFRNGVNLIVGSHPHVPQDFEISYNSLKDSTINRAVFYSLGNFVSNQSNPVQTRIAMMVSFKIVKQYITNYVKIINADYQYLWCFRPYEFEKGYCVAPVRQVIDNSCTPDKSLSPTTTSNAIERMMRSVSEYHL